MPGFFASATPSKESCERLETFSSNTSSSCTAADLTPSRSKATTPSEIGKLPWLILMFGINRPPMGGPRLFSAETAEPTAAENITGSVYCPFEA